MPWKITTRLCRDIQVMIFDHKWHHVTSRRDAAAQMMLQWSAQSVPNPHHPNDNHELQWRNNGCDGVSNHQPLGCLLNRLLRRRSKKPSKLRVTGLCLGNSPVTGEFLAQMASYAENVSIDDVIMWELGDNLWWINNGAGAPVWCHALCIMQ